MQSILVIGYSSDTFCEDSQLPLCQDGRCFSHEGSEGLPALAEQFDESVEMHK